MPARTPRAQILLEMADDFVDQVATASAELARHRQSATVEPRDVLLHLGAGLG
jgi:transcription initiation factor TFIID subunit TAF12